MNKKRYTKKQTKNREIKNSFDDSHIEDFTVVPENHEMEDK